MQAYPILQSQSLPTTNGQRVLITGITGFVASHVALQFLYQGYIVRGTVRLQSRFEDLATSMLFAPFASRMESYLCEDVAEHDFTQAVKSESFHILFLEEVDSEESARIRRTPRLMWLSFCVTVAILHFPLNFFPLLGPDFGLPLLR